MTRHPHRGPIYHQEDYPGHAEDVFTVVRRGAHVVVPLIGTTHALLTRETTVLEPGVLDHKYYVRDIGTVREVTVKGGSESLKLVAVRHLPRPRRLPAREGREELDGGARVDLHGGGIVRRHGPVAHHHRAAGEDLGEFRGVHMRLASSGDELGEGDRPVDLQGVAVGARSGSRGGPVAQRDVANAGLTVRGGRHVRYPCTSVVGKFISVDDPPTDARPSPRRVP